MKNLVISFFVFIFMCCLGLSVKSQALQPISQITSDGKYLKLVKSTGQIVHVRKTSVKMELKAGVIILYDNSFSDHLINDKEVTLYSLTFTTVSVPSTGSASALLTAILALINT